MNGSALGCGRVIADTFDSALRAYHFFLVKALLRVATLGGARGYSTALLCFSVCVPWRLSELQTAGRICRVYI